MQINSVPNFKLVENDGHITTQWRNFHQQIVNQLQQFVNDERYLLPTQPSPRATSTEVSGLNDQKNLGGLYYHPTSNNPRVNLEKYEDGSSTPTGYEFVPQVTFHEIGETADLNAVPDDKRTGKIMVDPTDNTYAYIAVNKVWRKFALVAV